MSYDTTNIFGYLSQSPNGIFAIIVILFIVLIFIIAKNYKDYKANTIELVSDLQSAVRDKNKLKLLFILICIIIAILLIILAIVLLQKQTPSSPNPSAKPTISLGHSQEPNNSVTPYIHPTKTPNAMPTPIVKPTPSGAVPKIGNSNGNYSMTSLFYVKDNILYTSHGSDIVKYYLQSGDFESISDVLAWNFSCINNEIYFAGQNLFDNRESGNIGRDNIFKLVDNKAQILVRNINPEIIIKSFLIDENRIFYNGIGDDGLPCIMSSNLDGLDNRVIREGTIFFEGIDEEWLYYYEYSDDAKVACRIKKDGSEEEELIQTCYFSLDENLLYYLSHSKINDMTKHELSVCDKNGTNIKKVLSVSGSIGYFIIEGDFVYFLYSEDDPSVTQPRSIYRYKIDGTGNVQKLVENMSIDNSRFNIFNDWIYFKSNGSIIKLSIDGNEKHIIPITQSIKLDDIEAKYLLQAQNHYNNGNYSEMLRIYNLDIMMDNTVALKNIGFMMNKGIFFNEDQDEALKFYDKAIASGDDEAVVRKFAILLGRDTEDEITKNAIIDLLKFAVSSNSNMVCKYLVSNIDGFNESNWRDRLTAILDGKSNEIQKLILQLKVYNTETVPVSKNGVMSYEVVTRSLPKNIELINESFIYISE